MTDRKAQFPPFDRRWRRALRFDGYARSRSPALPTRDVAVRFSKQPDIDTEQEDDKLKADGKSNESPDIRAANTGNNDSVEQTGQRTSHRTNQQRQTPSAGLWAPCFRQDRDDRPDQKNGNKSPATGVEEDGPLPQLVVTERFRQITENSHGEGERQKKKHPDGESFYSPSDTRPLQKRTPTSMLRLQSRLHVDLPIRTR